MKDLYEVLGISESEGVGFPSIYGAKFERIGGSPIEEEDSETPEEIKTEERAGQENAEGSDQDGTRVKYPAEEPHDDEDNVVEDNNDGGDQTVNTPTSDQHIPINHDDVQLLGDDDDESDFEISSQPEGEKDAESPLTVLYGDVDSNMNTSDIKNTEDFFNDMYSESTGSEIKVRKKYKIKLNKKSPKIIPIKVTKNARFKIKAFGNKRKFDMAINPAPYEKPEKKNSIRRSKKRVVMRSKSREKLATQGQPRELQIGEAKIPVNKALTNTPSPEKSKRRRISSLALTPGHNISSEEKEYQCPVKDCRQVVKSDDKNLKIYKLLKHFIQKHLSESPCKLYDSSEIRYPKSKTRYKCHYCDKINESSSSMFGHMALHHDDLFTRLQARLRDTSDQHKSKSLLHNIDGYLSLKWPRWAQCRYETVREYLNKSKSVRGAFTPRPDVKYTESKETFKEDSTAKVQQSQAEASPSPPAPPTVSGMKGEKKDRSSNLTEIGEDEDNHANSVVDLVDEPSTESLDPDLSSVTIVCKHCDFPYSDDEDLRNHLLGKHSSLFYEIRLLQAGEKFYECESNCQSFRTKQRLQFAKHLYRAHDIVSGELIADKDSWNGKLLSYKNFCYVTNNEDFLEDTSPVSFVSHIPASVVEIILEKVPKDTSEIVLPSNTENVMEQAESVVKPPEDVEDSAPDPCLDCPYLNCDEQFPRKNELLNHYLSKHPTSSVVRQFVEMIHPEVGSAELANLQIDQSSMTVFSCIFCPASFVREDLFLDHCSFHQNPRDLIQCEHCVGFIERTELEAHATPAQCPHFEERKRLLKLREVWL